MNISYKVCKLYKHISTNVKKIDKFIQFCDESKIQLYVLIY